MDLKDITANDIMVTDVVTAKPEDKIGTVDLMMIRAAIGGVPVVNSNNQLLGILTQRDIMLSRFTAQISSSKVEDLMTMEVIACHPDTCMKEILKLMLDNNIERLPVVNGENKLVGLISHKKLMERFYNCL